MLTATKSSCPSRVLNERLYHNSMLLLTFSGPAADPAAAAVLFPAIPTEC
jgi:hypothetical protein